MFVLANVFLQFGSSLTSSLNKHEKGKHPSLYIRRIYDEEK